MVDLECDYTRSVTGGAVRVLEYGDRVDIEERSLVTSSGRDRDVVGVQSKVGSEELYNC